MQTTTTTCDRCKVEVDPAETVELNMITTILDEEDENGYAEMWDVCPSCRDVIRALLVEIFSPVS